MRIIKLTQGKQALVDDEDFDYINRFKWSYANGYATTHFLGKSCLMHRLIMNPPKEMEVDHINHNRSDNRKENLRVCTPSQNRWNVTKRTSNTSGFKGISWDSDRNKWLVQIQALGIKRNLGRFSSLSKAKKVYNSEAYKFHKEFMFSNKIKA